MALVAQEYRGRHDDIRVALRRLQETRPLLDHAFPAVSIQIGLEVARLQLAVGDIAAARAGLSDIERRLARRPRLRTLHGEARDLRQSLESVATPGDGWARSITRAELRVLPYLATPLTFREMSRRLAVSPNTVKTQAISVYRKLGVSNRADAVERAIELGLIAAVWPL